MAWGVSPVADGFGRLGKSLAFEMVKKLVLAWDPDFMKLTPTEQAELEQAEAEMDAGEYVLDSAVNWD